MVMATGPRLNFCVHSGQNTDGARVQVALGSSHTANGGGKGSGSRNGVCSIIGNISGLCVGNGSDNVVVME